MKKIIERRGLNTAPVPTRPRDWLKGTDYLANSTTKPLLNIELNRGLINRFLLPAFN